MGQASAVTIPIIFPLEIRVPVLHDYLAPRVGHLHQGTDLLAPKMTKELAAVGGTVTLRVSTYNGVPAYSLWLKGDDGHGYNYIHINNDTPGTDDGLGGLQNAFAPGLVTGSRVEQGQFIAYVGDSGNAENTVPHLHFEIRETTSMSSPSIDPYDSVANAPLAGTDPPDPPDPPDPDPEDPELTRYEQHNPNLLYTGRWDVYTTSKASGGTYLYANSTAKALIKFTGTRLDLIGTLGINQGKARVTLDGGTPAVVDLFSATVLHQQTVWSSGTVNEGEHLVTVEWTGQTSAPSGSTVVNIDAVAVAGTLLQAPVVLTTYQQTSSLLGFTGSWSTGWSSAASGGSHRVANGSGASVTVKFTGTYLAWLAKKSPLYGVARVTVDGGTPVTVDLYSATTLWKQRVWNTGTLDSGTHTVKIEWNGTKNTRATDKYIGVDAFEVAGGLVQAPALTRYEQTSSKLVYGKTWSTGWSSAASGGSHRYANASGASVTVKFTGTYLAWLAKKSPVYGIAKVTVDGGTPVLVDLYSATTLWKQKVWNTGTLGHGTHTVKIEWTGTKNAKATDKNISIDAFEVVGSLN